MQTQLFALPEDYFLFDEYFSLRNAKVYQEGLLPIEVNPQSSTFIEKSSNDWYIAWDRSKIQYRMTSNREQQYLASAESECIQLSTGKVLSCDAASIQISRGRIYLGAWSWLEEAQKQPQWLVDEYKAMRRWITKTAYPYPWAPRCKVYIFPAAMKLLEGKNVEIR